MKKIISFVMVLILISLSCVPVLASENNQPASQDLFEDRFIEQYGWPSFYSELYYHYTEQNGEMSIDWAFIHCVKDMWDTFGFSSYLILGDKVFEPGDVEYKPFFVPYAVYDVEKDEFIDIQYADYTQYEGIEECMNKWAVGRVIGDMDIDGTLSVLDATVIQRCFAGIEEFSQYDLCESYNHSAVYGTEKLAYYSDFDRDGKRTILDATAIQHKLAGLEY